MNQKKESIIKSNLNEFIDILMQLNNAYSNNNEIKIYKLPCILERQATRLFTHFEDWTTTNDEIQYKNKLKEIIKNKLKNEIILHENLKIFIQEQQDFDGMMYYTYELLKFNLK